jgi:Na+/pantothenate symporter
MKFYIPYYTECFLTFAVITYIYNKKTKGPTLMEFFTATRKLKKVFFSN